MTYIDEVWVATRDPYHDNSTVLGVAATMVDAQRLCIGPNQRTDRPVDPLEWDDRSDDDIDRAVAEATDGSDDYFTVQRFAT